MRLACKSARCIIHQDLLWGNFRKTNQIVRLVRSHLLYLTTYSAFNTMWPVLSVRVPIIMDTHLDQQNK